MARTMKATEQAVERTRLGQGDLITRAQALSCGLSQDALRHRIRAGGPWKVVLPGIYLTHSGMLTGGQREIAAALYAGPEYAITGLTALQRHGIRVPLAETVDVLIPATRKRQSAGFVHTRRTHRMPEPPWLSAGIRWAPAARAVADAARVGSSYLTSVRSWLMPYSDANAPSLSLRLSCGPDRLSGPVPSPPLLRKSLPGSRR